MLWKGLVVVPPFSLPLLFLALSFYLWFLHLHYLLPVYFTRRIVVPKHTFSLIIVRLSYLVHIWLVVFNDTLLNKTNVIDISMGLVNCMQVRRCRMASRRRGMKAPPPAHPPLAATIFIHSICCTDHLNKRCYIP